MPSISAVVPAVAAEHTASEMPLAVAIRFYAQFRTVPHRHQEGFVLGVELLLRSCATAARADFCFSTMLPLESKMMPTKRAHPYG